MIPFILADAAPFAGKLAFASVFVALVIWLLFIPKSRLAEARDGSDAPKPFWKQARVWAIAIAVLQCFIYLLW
jgi:hypothetical protein